MVEAWIPVRCPDCDEHWEENPASLPAPGVSFECPHCGERRPVSEFASNRQSLGVLKAFHSV